VTVLRWLTAGESHGPMLVATLEGLPAGLPIDEETIARDLARRQKGYGRGGRMKIETDRARIVTGVRHGATIGAPVSMLIENRDHANWLTRMKVGPLADGEDPGALVSLPRPGHADLAGGLKYERTDLRDVLERASARETAARVALGAVAKELLRALDIVVGSAVLSIHDAQAKPILDVLPGAEFDAELLSQRADLSEVRSIDEDAAARMIAAIQASQKRRDTVGGIFEVRLTGVPPGIGSYVQWDRKLDGRFLQALGSIHAIKAVEVGDGWLGASRYGTEVHDPILRAGPAFARSSNHAGGLEGGVTNGQPIVVRAAMKPIATVSNALPSVDLQSGLVDRAHIERSDTCAVPAAAVVGEAMAALCLAEALLDTWGADTVSALQAQVRAAWRRSRRFPSHLYLCGLSGSGKTTVGRKVAEALAMPFVDLDDAIERETGRSVRDLFASEGEAAFRLREVETLRRVSADRQTVIALGGGTITQRAARDLLRRSGDVFWLKAPIALLASRLSGDASRPLLAGKDPVEALTDLETRRAAMLQLAADATIDAGAPAELVAQRVVGAWGALR
jgi:chorismate synthase